MLRTPRVYFGLLLLLAALTASARIGADLEGLEALYEKGHEVTAAPPATKAYRFVKDGHRIQAEMIEGRCVRIAYLPSPESSWTDDQIKKFLGHNVGDHKWEDAPKQYFNPRSAAAGEKPLMAWARSDKQAYAHIGELLLDVIAQEYINAILGALDTARKQAEFQRLSRQMPNSRYEDSLKILQEISVLGPEYYDEVARLALGLLRKNQRSLLRALNQAGSFDSDAYQALDEQRHAALAHIAELTKENASLREARQNHKDLIREQKRLERSLASRWNALQTALEFLQRHQQLLRIIQQLETAERKYVPNDVLKSVMDAVSNAYGVSVDELTSFPPPSGNPPTAPALRELWLYHFNRRIEAYNKELMGPRVTSRPENHNLEALNEYREALGLHRLELDERLLQAARRHSKQMVDLGYFSHESPKEETKTFDLRIRAAGYPQAGGENIAMGRTNGVEVFWMWFDSPGHHQNMVRDAFQAIGVGKWQDHWTQNFGNGPLLLFATEKERAAVRPQGDILKP